MVEIVKVEVEIASLRKRYRVIFLLMMSSFTISVSDLWLFRLNKQIRLCPFADTIKHYTPSFVLRTAIAIDSALAAEHR